MLSHLVRAVVLVLAVVAPCVATAATFYVDKNNPACDDAGAGTEAQPWCTLHRAVDGRPSREYLADGVTPGIATVFTAAQVAQAGDTVFVKDGVYHDLRVPNFSTGVNTEIVVATPTFNPINGGTTIAPIAFRAYTPPSGPRHRPMVSRELFFDPVRNGDRNNPVIGMNGSGFARNSIIWDGFVLAPKTDMTVRGSRNVIIENILCDKGPAEDVPNPTGNYTCLFMQNAENAIVRNNVFRNVFFPSRLDLNAACLKHFEVRDALVHNNLFENCNSAIDDKRGGQGNVYEKNYFRGMTAATLKISNFSILTERLVFRNNVVNDGGDAVVRIEGGSAIQPPTRDITISNNTFYGGPGNRIGIVVQPQMLLGTAGPPSLNVFDNIIMRDQTISTGGEFGHLVFAGSPSGSTGPPQGLFSNFNLFFGLTAPNAVIMPVSGSGAAGALSLANWQAQPIAQDANSIAADPLLVGPLEPTAPVTAFRLQAGSPARGAGRAGGVAAGAVQDLGAWATGTEIIGPTDAIAPSPPTGVTVR
jgi:hypothetical protein